MCKTKNKPVTFHVLPESNGLLCDCGNPAVWSIGWKLKHKRGYIVFTFCSACGEGFAKFLIESGVIKPDDSHA